MLTVAQSILTMNGTLVLRSNKRHLKGLIVHEGTDFVSQPSGNAGARGLFKSNNALVN
jgi:Cu/Zn superoxide dismutase